MINHDHSHRYRLWRDVEVKGQPWTYSPAYWTCAHDTVSQEISSQNNRLLYGQFSGKNVSLAGPSPVSKRRYHNAVSMLGHRLRRWPSIKTALRLVDLESADAGDFSLFMFLSADLWRECE